MSKPFTIHPIKSEHFEALGNLMVKVYSALDGFPKPSAQPEYYKMLRNISQLSKQDHTQVFVATDSNNKVLAGVVYFSDMSMYGSGGTATLEKHASGIRLLGVDPNLRRSGIGKALTIHCINLAIQAKHKHVILHTTSAMQGALTLYKKLGFIESPDLDFYQQQLAVYGFRLQLADLLSK
jgi:ribosomal protein S18 acetylase RimI-like enzyme